MKKRIIASIVFFIVCIISTIIYGIDANVVINPSKSTVKPGEEVTFTVRVKDITSEKGATGIEGKISYDASKFELIETEDVTRGEIWDAAFNKDNGKVIAEGMTLLKNDANVINIKLKIKNDSSLIGQTATVSLNEVMVYDDETKDVGTVSASVKIGEEASSEQKPTPTTKPTPTATAKPDGGSESTPTPSTRPGGTNTTPTPTATAKPNSGENKNDVPVTNIDTNTSSGSSSTNKGNTSLGGSSSSSNKGSTTSSSSLPKAGIGSTITILTIAAALLGIVAYIKLRNYREI